MIVIEGMDNSGKSTLALRMADYMDLLVQESEGPPQSPEEINERVERYAVMQDRLFVRHPCVSNIIYDTFRPIQRQGWINPGNIMNFYDARPVLIYCDGGVRGLQGHIEKTHDDGDHIEMITKNYNDLLQQYRLWAGEHAHFVYRIGDDMDTLVSTVFYYINRKD